MLASLAERMRMPVAVGFCMSDWRKRRNWKRGWDERKVGLSSDWGAAGARGGGGGRGDDGSG